MGVLRNVSHNLFGGYRLCKSCCFDEIFQLIILPFLSQLLKPQVERRRRERMNRSLEGLRHLLLQGVQQEVKDYTMASIHMCEKNTTCCLLLFIGLASIIKFLSLFESGWRAEAN